MVRVIGKGRKPGNFKLVDYMKIKVTTNNEGKTIVKIFVPKLT